MDRWLKEKKRVIKKVLILVVVSIFIGGCICLGDAVIKLVRTENVNKENVDTSNIKAKGFVEDDGRYKLLAGHSGKITININAYVNKFQYSYITNGFNGNIIYVYEENIYGQEECTKIKDNLLRDMPRSVVNINNKISKMVIQFEDIESDVEISEFVVDNSFKPNPYLFFFWTIGSFFLLSLFVFKKEFAQHLAISTTFAIMMIGVILLSLQPPYFYSWDEQIHMKNIYSLGVTDIGEKLPESVAYLYDNVQFIQVNSMEERLDMMRILDAKNKMQSQMIDEYSFQLNSSGYIIQGGIFNLCSIAGLPFYICMLLSRGSNLLIYAFVLGLAVNLVPRGKRLLSIFALLPTPMFLSTVFTYDTIVTAFVILGLAIILRQFLERDEKFTIKMQCLFFACIVIGCLPKAVYAPLLLTGFFVPKNKFESKKNMYVFKTFILIGVLVLLSTFVLPTLISPNVSGDVRGGEDTSVSRQLMLIMHKPLSYALVLLTNIKDTFVKYTLGADAIGHFAYFGMNQQPILCALLLGGVVLTDSYKEKEGLEKINWKHRCIIWGSIAITITLIWTAMYLSFTEVGKLKIAGVQGRYYLHITFFVC